jgi:opacity protein-like surface antigen
LALSGVALGQNQTGAQVSRPSYDQGAIGIGARLGSTNVERVSDLALQYGAFADYALSNNLLVGGGVDYWSQSEGLEEIGIVETSDLSVSAHGKFLFLRDGVVRPFALAGLALHRFETNVSQGSGGVEVEAASEDEDTDVLGQFGADLGAGVIVRIQQNFDAIGEVRARTLFDTSVERDQMTFTGGLAYRLGGITRAAE